MFIFKKLTRAVSSSCRVRAVCVSIDGSVMVE
jgi:hypothetical protein